MTKFDDLLADQLKDPEFKKEWDALDPEFSAIETPLPAGELPPQRLRGVSDRDFQEIR